MTVASRLGARTFRYAAVSCVLALVVAAGVWPVIAGSTGVRLTAYFSQAVGVYPGSAVRVLGIDVGTIESVTPEGTLVKVELVVDADVRVPEQVRAIVVAPSLVSDRYVQLAPVYTGGPEIADGAKIPRERTATPVEIDDLSKTLDELNVALGPEGANRDGALTRLLDTSAANLDGTGKSLNETLRELNAAAGTLANSKGDLFETVDNLQRFTSTLAASDSQIHEFNGRMAEVTGFLAADSDEIGAALGSLADALEEVRAFIEDNRTALQSNVDKLAVVTKVLVDQRAALAEVLDVSPVAVANLINTYDAASGTQHSRNNLNELTYPPVMMLCMLIRQSAPAEIPADVRDACLQLAPVIDGAVPLPSVAEVLGGAAQGKQPALPLPMVGVDVPGQGGR
ncbi:virulence factor Mce family protein [Actinokineospora alba]|uniref:Virulence factor Mce family protein n=1 Tax=Actinokineospora alba TaxID=504798 RepID=A0A1H0NI21_9PSEU|nr:MCE family protein [Actinokineospora alba]TDP68727.1 virulence factor Mce-like protein [Actinokineospora alba]SDH85337.1 virulence factor Mce family protein [Actinokineospora alba]SDO92309.1 virulence factor Mce family protein [Actinokineospora alba]